MSELRVWRLVGPAAIGMAIAAMLSHVKLSEPPPKRIVLEENGFTTTITARGFVFQKDGVRVGSFLINDRGVPELAGPGEL